jgi:diguanylate cyclase (GGDEF)-like protein
MFSLFDAFPPHAAQASRTNFRAYGVDQGLASLSGYCMLQDRAGYMLFCTEHGMFEYDGRHFLNLGPDQGLRQGQIVYDLDITADGRIAIAYTDQVFVSDAPSTASTHTGLLHFSPVAGAGLSFFSQQIHQLTAWRDGFVLLTKTGAVRIITSKVAPARFESMGYDRPEQALLDGASSLFAAQDHLWETFSDGRICIADPGAAKCFGAADGLRDGEWFDAVPGDGDTVLFRSASSVATFHPATGRWDVVRLPDQGTGYLNYRKQFELFRTPAGEFMTQSDHGLDILGPDGWRTLAVSDGAPDGTILDGLTDMNGQLWLQIQGRGAMRWLGYERFANLHRDDGLSSDVAWQTARSADGALWIATDSAIDQLVSDGGQFRVDGVYPGASFAVAIGPRGLIWTSLGSSGIRIIDPRGGPETKLAMPAVDVITAGAGGVMWMGTEHGLFRADAAAATPAPTLESSPRLQVNDIIADGDGGVFYLADGRLRRHKKDGADLPITGPWPEGGFNPLEIAPDHAGSFWIGGSGGLFRFTLSGDRTTSFQTIGTDDLRTNSVVAVMVDHRGWVWVGTTLGVSVFNGLRWVSFDTSSGLVSDDVSQGGLREDPDGSVWVATSAGVSHVLDPAHLFAQRPLRALLSSASIGARPVPTGSMPYIDEPLTLQFGTSNFGAERSVVFRYKLSGVDAGWADTVSGNARYPSVPPGRHVLTVMALDALTHRLSPPVTLPIHIRYPWWRRWWSLLLWTACALGLGYAGLRIRFRALLARQRELQRHVDEATAQLRYLAAHDDLTGLLNRNEVERRLAAKLATGRAGDETIVALIDLDFFKQVNDRHGHIGGDDILRAFGRLVSRAIRDGEYAGRYGGEELLVVIDDADGLGSKRILDLHRTVRYDTFKAAGAAIHITCSIGLAWARAGDNWETLVGRADQALYEAKRTGRDRVIESRNLQTPAPVGAIDPGGP